MSLNTHPHHFRFALRETVRVIASGLTGTVTGQCTSLYAQDSFLVRFHSNSAEPTRDWLYADEIEPAQTAVGSDADRNTEALVNFTAADKISARLHETLGLAQAEGPIDELTGATKFFRLPYSRFLIPCRCGVSVINDCKCVQAYQQKIDATDIDAVHQAEARAEDTAVAQANVAADTPKPIFFSLSTPTLPIDPRKSDDSFATFSDEYSGASFSLYIPDIEQKPGESLTDFLLRAAAALQGQAATL